MTEVQHETLSINRQELDNIVPEEVRDNDTYLGDLYKRAKRFSEGKEGIGVKYWSRVLNKDITIFEAFTEILREKGVEQPESWVADSKINQDITDANLLRLLINRYWRLKIANYPFPTIVNQMVLIDDGKFESWLTIFSESVATCVKLNQDGYTEVTDPE